MSDEKQEQRVNKKNKARTILAVLGIAILIAGLATASVLLGWVAITVKSPNQNVTVRTVVCGDEVINKYNSIYSAVTSSEEEYAANAAKLADYSKEIEQKASIEQDPTCQYILFTAALNSNDASKAKELVAKIEQLAQKGHFVNTNLNGVMDIDQMKLRSEILGTDSPTGSG